jgi:hypothetical protein
VGFFGTYLFSDGQWAEVDPNAPLPQSGSEPWLHLDIHDSDVATVQYQPHGNALGIAYLGTTPHVYFENEGASAPTDRASEAEALAAWAREARAVDVEGRLVETYLAADDDAQPDESADLDAADIFVEVKCARFCLALGLPVPAGLE